MNKNLVVAFSIAVCFTFLLSLPIHSQADNDFSASVNAMQQQGFIRPDAGGPIGSGEMALDPFRNADSLNHGGIFGPLGGPNELDGFSVPPPNTRDLGFGSDNDRFMPINWVISSD